MDFEFVVSRIEQFLYYDFTFLEKIGYFGTTKHPRLKIDWALHR